MNLDAKTVNEMDNVPQILMHGPEDSKPEIYSKEVLNEILVQVFRDMHQKEKSHLSNEIGIRDFEERFEDFQVVNNNVMLLSDLKNSTVPLLISLEETEPIGIDYDNYAKSFITTVTGITTARRRTRRGTRITGLNNNLKFLCLNNNPEQGSFEKKLVYDQTLLYKQPQIINKLTKFPTRMGSDEDINQIMQLRDQIKNKNTFEKRRQIDQRNSNTILEVNKIVHDKRKEAKMKKFLNPIHIKLQTVNLPKHKVVPLLDTKPIKKRTAKFLPNLKQFAKSKNHLELSGVEMQAEITDLLTNTLPIDKESFSFSDYKGRKKEMIRKNYEYVSQESADELVKKSQFYQRKSKMLKLPEIKNIDAVVPNNMRKSVSMIRTLAKDFKALLTNCENVQFKTLSKRESYVLLRQMSDVDKFNLSYVKQINVE